MGKYYENPRVTSNTLGNQRLKDGRTADFQWKQYRVQKDVDYLFLVDIFIYMCCLRATPCSIYSLLKKKKIIVK